MTDKPIIFSAPMVRALFDGSKTQTRRIMKPQPAPSVKRAWDNRDGTWSIEQPVLNELFPRPDFIPPKTKVGCRLWVRENWRVGAWLHHERAIAVDYPADDFARKEWLDVADLDQHTRLVEQSRADAEKAGLIKSGAEFEYRWSPGDSPCRTRPSIHMPRWASRLTLTVTDVRVERLQDISKEDALAEGVHPDLCPDEPRKVFADNMPAHLFGMLWESINGVGSWDQNPWVVAYTFTVMKRNIDA